MAFEPDIIVTTPNGRIMVIEAKVAINDLGRTEEALKRYMIGMQYPFGLLITPEKGWVYRDSFSNFSPASIERIEEFDSTRIWGHKAPRSPIDFEAFVQRWIEDLAEFPTDSLPPHFKDVIQGYVLPAIIAGEVKAAHPR